MNDKDLDNLRLLKVLHLLYGVLHAIFICVPAFFVFLGFLLLENPEQYRTANPNDPPIEILAGFFIFMGFVMVFALILFGILQFIVVRSLAQRKWHLFCLIVAVLNCLNIPWGTMIGVPTLMVLLKPSVKALFQINT